jgi:NADH-quinone oxidoreductase subunit J
MSPLHMIFYVFATVAVCSAVAVVTVRNPVHSVLSLVVTFFAMAAIWMMLRAEFLSLTLLLVYVGAVMTLFLFVVMMLNIRIETKRGGFIRYLSFGGMLVVLMVGLLIAAIGRSHFNSIPMPAPLSESIDYSNIKQLGTLLFTQYIYPFEIAGVLLLAAIIAAITLTHRFPKHCKAQQPSKQIAIQRQDRIRLVNMPAEKKVDTV